MKYTIDLYSPASSWESPETVLERWGAKASPFLAVEIPVKATVRVKNGKTSLEIALLDPEEYVHPAERAGHEKM